MSNPIDKEQMHKLKSPTISSKNFSSGHKTDGEHNASLTKQSALQLNKNNCTSSKFPSAPSKNFATLHKTDGEQCVCLAKQSALQLIKNNCTI